MSEPEAVLFEDAQLLLDPLHDVGPRDNCRGCGSTLALTRWSEWHRDGELAGLLSQSAILRGRCVERHEVEPTFWVGPLDEAIAFHDAQAQRVYVEPVPKDEVGNHDEPVPARILTFGNEPHQGDLRFPEQEAA